MTIPAKIERIDEQIFAVISTRTVTGRLELPSRDFGKLKDGDFIDIEIHTDRDEMG